MISLQKFPFLFLTAIKTTILPHLLAYLLFYPRRRRYQRTSPTCMDFLLFFLRKKKFLQSRDTASEWTVWSPFFFFFWSVSPIFLPTLIRRYVEKSSIASSAAIAQLYPFDLFYFMYSDLFGVSLTRPAT